MDRRITGHRESIPSGQKKTSLPQTICPELHSDWTNLGHVIVIKPIKSWRGQFRPTPWLPHLEKMPGGNGGVYDVHMISFNPPLSTVAWSFVFFSYRWRQADRQSDVPRAKLVAYKGRAWIDSTSVSPQLMLSITVSRSPVLETRLGAWLCGGSRLQRLRKRL